MTGESKPTTTTMQNDKQTDNLDLDYKLFDTLFRDKKRICVTYAVKSTKGLRHTMEDTHSFITDMDRELGINSGFKPHILFGVT